MAYFNNLDLHDYIINGIKIENDTGVCNVFEEETAKKCRPGGLPIIQQDDSFDEISIPEQFDINIYNPQYRGFENNLILKPNERKIKFGKVIYDPSLYGSAELLPIFLPSKQENVEKPLSPISTKFSTSQDENLKIDDKIDIPFDIYAKYNFDYDKSKGKIINVLFTFSDKLKKKTICIDPEATVADFIGLSMYTYCLEYGNPPAIDIKDYSVYLAEDNKADMDFPKLSLYTKIYKVLFENLALVLKSDILDEPSVVVNVYFITGEAYKFEVESQDTPLYIIFDEAMTRKKKETSEVHLPGLRFCKEYVMETLEKPGQIVDLNSTLANCSSKGFIILRKNSSRGDFLADKTTINIEEIPSTSVNNETNSISPRKTKSKVSMAAPIVEMDEEFICERIHKFRPNWSATLAIRNDGFELTPISIERRHNVVSQPTQKHIFVDYDALGGVWLGSDRLSGRRYVKIVYIHIEANKMSDFFTKLREINQRDSEYLRLQTQNESKTRQSSIDSSSSVEFHTRSNSISFLLEETRWKTLTLATRETDDWKIVSTLNTILEARISYIRQLYLKSKNGTRSPFDSSLVLNKNISRENSILDELPQTPRSQRKFSVNPISRISRMLSKQE